VGRAGADTVRYGGDTSSVAIAGDGGNLLILDAGSGITHAYQPGHGDIKRIDVLLTHLHMDHIQGLGFFAPLLDPNIETHIWGPASSNADLAQRLGRYLSPPLFPVRLRDLAAVHMHDVLPGPVDVPGFDIIADLIIHPGPTLGYRLTRGGRSVAYLPDHEPALGWPSMSAQPHWLSGYKLVDGVNLLIHDAQYSDEEYQQRVGWGHSSFSHCLALAGAAGVDRLVTYHHDPEHSDDQLDRLHENARQVRRLSFELLPGTARASFEV
jgi:phosphoribosyl 1,2-cyclic phosphodiesterase